MVFPLTGLPLLPPCFTPQTSFSLLPASPTDLPATTAACHGPLLLLSTTAVLLFLHFFSFPPRGPRACCLPSSCLLPFQDIMILLHVASLFCLLFVPGLSSLAEGLQPLSLLWFCMLGRFGGGETACCAGRGFQRTSGFSSRQRASGCVLLFWRSLSVHRVCGPIGHISAGRINAAANICRGWA